MSRQINIHLLLIFNDSNVKWYTITSHCNSIIPACQLIMQYHAFSALHYQTYRVKRIANLSNFLCQAQSSKMWQNKLYLRWILSNILPNTKVTTLALPYSAQNIQQLKRSCWITNLKRSKFQVR